MHTSAKWLKKVIQTLFVKTSNLLNLKLALNLNGNFCKFWFRLKIRVY